MSRGGFRPGCGRPKGATDKKQRKRRGAPGKKNIKPKEPKPVKPIEKTATDEQHDRIKLLLGQGTNAKAKIFRDLVNKLAMGQTLTSSETKTMLMLERELSATIGTGKPEPDEIPGQASAEDLDPLTYMLKIMNDPTEEKELRARMAIAAAPFVHARKGEGAGKKQDKDDRAKQAGQGKFGAGAPPLRRVK